MLKYSDLKRGDTLVSNFDEFEGVVTGLVNFNAMTYITSSDQTVRRVQPDELGGYFKKEETDMSDVDFTYQAPNEDGRSTEEIEMQKVWRTLSQSNNSGFFVWEVLQVVGETRNVDYFVDCRDGSYISIACYHTWTLERAKDVLNDDSFSRYQIVEIINGPIKRGDWVKSSHLNLKGVVEDIAPCGNHNCNKMELTLDRNGKGPRYYHHVEHFELMTEEEVLKEIREPSAD